MKIFAKNSHNPYFERHAALSGGYDFANTLHHIYADFGYPESLSFPNFWSMYRRFGIARRVVEAKVDLTWRDKPVLEASDEFIETSTKLDLWRRLEVIDVMQRIGRYAGYFMRVRDGRKPSEPLLPGTLNGAESVVQMLPLYESQLRVESTDNNIESDDFGMPKMYQVYTGNIGNTDPDTNAWANVHPTRVVIASERAIHGIYGISCLEAPYNSLMDLQKVIGAGAEGLYRNAAQNVVFELQDVDAVAGNEELLEKFNEEFDKFIKDRMRRGLWAPGMKTTQLNAKPVDPEHFFMNALFDVAAAEGTPAQVIVGAQTGRLAGSNDIEQFLALIQTRREGFGSQLTTKMLDWLILYGVLPADDFKLKWPDALAQSYSQRIENAKVLSDINTANPAFTIEEVREAAGYPAEPDGTLPAPPAPVAGDGA